MLLPIAGNAAEHSTAVVMACALQTIRIVRIRQLRTFALLALRGGCLCDHATAPPPILCVLADKGKMDVALGVALGSSTQIALFVIPVMVIIGWGMGQPLDLHFGTFETCITFLSSLIVFFIVQNGETNWLEGQPV